MARESGYFGISDLCRYYGCKLIFQGPLEMRMEGTGVCGLSKILHFSFPRIFFSGA